MSATKDEEKKQKLAFTPSQQQAGATYTSSNTSDTERRIRNEFTNCDTGEKNYYGSSEKNIESQTMNKTPIKCSFSFPIFDPVKDCLGLE